VIFGSKSGCAEDLYFIDEGGSAVGFLFGFFQSRAGLVLHFLGIMKILGCAYRWIVLFKCGLIGNVVFKNLYADLSSLSVLVVKERLGDLRSMRTSKKFRRHICLALHH
jgi:hypothetical protein